MRGLSGKYAIVTGGGKGIGVAIARRYLEEALTGGALLAGILGLTKTLAMEAAKSRGLLRL